MSSNETTPVLIPPTWPLLVYYGMSLVSLPLYIMVFISLIRLRCISKIYNSTFYTILLQHCIADLLAMAFFFATSPLRNIPAIRLFYFEYQQYYIAAGSYNSIYYFLYVRCSGIILLSLQRFFVITEPYSVITIIVQNTASWKIIVLFWAIPTIISIIVLKDVDIYFDTLKNMSVIVDKDIINRNTLMALIVVGITCIICFLVYGALGYYIRINSAGISRNLKREIHLAAQVFFLLISFIIILIYYAFQNYFSQNHNTGPIFYMRALYPVANGLLSYINPFCILFLNKDLSRQVWKTVRCRKYKISEVQISHAHSNSVKSKHTHRGVKQHMSIVNEC